mmetsp:Transcript_9077/g.23321  ORF Transcript_9077/g.23321 Transcript_9077/m.23321 type:complete len:109 (-) Transcript_9077:401-727(-)
MRECHRIRSLPLMRTKGSWVRGADREAFFRSRSLVTNAKYGDESIYFDLEDIENTSGSWDMYGTDVEKRYPDLQNEFFERAGTGIARREALLGIVALGKPVFLPQLSN